MKAILQDTIQVQEERIEVKDKQIARLMQQVDELRKDAKGYKASSERWKQNCEDIGNASNKQEQVAYDQECQIEQLQIDLEHAMAQNKALVAHSLEMDDVIMEERKRAHRENKAFQVEQAKEIENLELELERVTGDSLQVQVEKMHEMVEVLWNDRSFNLCCGVITPQHRASVLWEEYNKS